MEAPEVPLTGGRTTQGVVRVGDTVRRPMRPNAPFVHALLRHLEAVGFDGAPRYLDVDIQGREILSFIEGRVPPDLGWFTDSQIIAAAKLIRRYHEATAGSALADVEEVVCHNDLSPCNAVFVDDAPIAWIDFDAAAPGPRLRDLAYAAWLWLDIGNDDIAAPEQSRRLCLFCDGYGREMMTGIIETIIVRQRELESSALTSLDFSLHQRTAASAWARACREWVERHRATLS